MAARLKARGVGCACLRGDAQGLLQPFLFDPNGGKLELELGGSEVDAAGVVQELMASDLPR
jgi:hypothetical protein